MLGGNRHLGSDGSGCEKWACRGGHSGFFSLAEDAPAGTTVSIPKADVFGRPVPASKRMLLVVLDSCTTCAAKSIKRGPKPEDLTLPAIFVFTDTRAHVLAEMKGPPKVWDGFWQILISSLARS